jgi:hypothetical protein
MSADLSFSSSFAEIAGKPPAEQVRYVVVRKG